MCVVDMFYLGEKKGGKLWLHQHYFNLNIMTIYIYTYYMYFHVLILNLFNYPEGSGNHSAVSYFRTLFLLWALRLNKMKTFPGEMRTVEYSSATDHLCWIPLSLEWHPILDQ